MLLGSEKVYPSFNNGGGVCTLPTKERLSARAEPVALWRVLSRVAGVGLGLPRDVPRLQARPTAALRRAAPARSRRQALGPLCHATCVTR